MWGFYFFFFPRICSYSSTCHYFIYLPLTAYALSQSGQSISETINMTDGREFPSGCDVTPSASGGRRRQAAGISSVNWMQPCTSLTADISPQLPDLGRSHGIARGPKLLPLFISDGGGHFYITGLIGKISNTHATRSDLKISECFGFKGATGRFELKSREAL